MISQLFKRLPDIAGKRPKPVLLCAIGDVHGEAERLARLHEILFDRHARYFPDHQLKIIHLGDYVDRGPDSAGVVDLCIRLQARRDVETVFLRGNHEDMLVKAQSSGSSRHHAAWLMNGGEATLSSYSKGVIPRSHLEWMGALPLIHIEASARMIFVHAGIDPRTFPNESENTYLWTRSDTFFDVSNWNNRALQGWTIVHGHTPTRNFYPEKVAGHAKRINIDTGAAFGGRLTAALFAEGQPVSFYYS